MQKVFKLSLIVSVPAALLPSAAVTVLLRPSSAGLVATEEPQVIANTSGRFTTALDFYNYNHAAMPWYAPGSMIEAETWQVTAFLVRENGVDPIQTPLTPTKAAKLLLHTGQSAMTTAPALQAESWMARSWPWISAVFLFIFIASALYLRNKNVSRRRE